MSQSESTRDKASPPVVTLFESYGSGADEIGPRVADALGVTYHHQAFSSEQLEAPADHGPILGGRRGHHSEHLGHLLAVMQFLPRTYPDAAW